MSFLEGSAHCLQFLHQHHLSSSSQQLPAAMSLGCQQQIHCILPTEPRVRRTSQWWTQRSTQSVTILTCA